MALRLILKRLNNGKLFALFVSTDLVFNDDFNRYDWIQIVRYLLHMNNKDNYNKQTRTLTKHFTSLTANNAMQESFL